MAFKPITRRQISDSSKLREFADDNFKFDENGSKLSKQVENTLGKGEIAHNEHFLLFPQCFQKACFPGASKGVVVWEWVKVHLKWKISTILGRKHCGKRRNCLLQVISPFLTMFSQLYIFSASKYGIVW